MKKREIFYKILIAHGLEAKIENVKCFICGRGILDGAFIEVEHINDRHEGGDIFEGIKNERVPLSKEILSLGNSEIKNEIALTCSNCNRLKWVFLSRIKKNKDVKYLSLLDQIRQQEINFNGSGNNEILRSLIIFVYSGIFYKDLPN